MFNHGVIKQLLGQHRIPLNYHHKNRTKNTREK